MVLTGAALPVDELHSWAATPRAGAVVTFVGIVRDHAEGRDGVHAMTYEAYEEPARRVMREIVAEARPRWPDIERVALLHRIGRLELSEPSVAVAVSSPHRDHAFDAARYCIDTLKETAPIWKQEHWTRAAVGARRAADPARRRTARRRSSCLRGDRPGGVGHAVPGLRRGRVAQLASRPSCCATVVRARRSTASRSSSGAARPRTGMRRRVGAGRPSRAAPCRATSRSTSGRRTRSSTRARRGSSSTNRRSSRSTAARRTCSRWDRKRGR